VDECKPLEKGSGGGGAGRGSVPAPNVMLGGSVSEAFIAVLPPAAAAATRRALTAAHVALVGLRPVASNLPYYALTLNLP
jgi:hypothetical protein